ncbi:hypothetical protein SAMN05192588_1185 [Nonlabens sp. Hel1_33_55]|uniref:hypothetical protein n=1 Tax=Nonlabens sp. Hel1_33_55 TaxID=1336802 RepID=UPI000875DC09|nr:hypothetical protein [Nonlabens sp. Hel1_33_55]SCY10759.1 hypothetical protein SAMN05192588_1185 [Nonlabens sp. Hel1_33_55]
MFQSKSSKLFFSVLFDLVGMASYAVPFVGELIDIIWAPIAGYLMTKVYPGKTGKTAGILTTIEELVPGLDIIPTFTLTWIYTYIIKKEDTQTSKEPQTIEVEAY